MPLTLQFTAVLVVFVTVAVKVVGLPSMTKTLAGLTVTAIAAGGGIGGGGGGNGDRDALPLPQPRFHRLWPKRRESRTVNVLEPSAKIDERDRMPSQKQAKGQRRDEGVVRREKKAGGYMCTGEIYLNEGLEGGLGRGTGSGPYRR